MSNQNIPAAGWIFIPLAVIIIFIGVLGILDLKKEAYAGFTYGGYSKIAIIEPGSPAERAGLKVGDVVKSMEGIEFGDAAEMRRPYPAIGETRNFIVEREGREVSLDITYSGLPKSDFMSRIIVQSVLGICFLICGLLAYYKHPSRETTVFAFFGSCFGLHALHLNLTINPYPWSVIYDIVRVIIFLLGFTALLHFTLLFPKTKKIMEKKIWSRILYLPPIPIFLYILIVTVFETDFTRTQFTLLQAYLVLFIVGYLILAVISLIQSLVKSTPEERRSAGLNIMLTGTLIAILPMIIGIFLTTINPSLSPPGEDYYVLTGMFLPLSWLWAVMKKEKS